MIQAATTDAICGIDHLLIAVTDPRRGGISMSWFRTVTTGRPQRRYGHRQPYHHARTRILRAARCTARTPNTHSATGGGRRACRLRGRNFECGGSSRGLARGRVFGDCGLLEAGVTRWRDQDAGALRSRHPPRPCRTGDGDLRLCPPYPRDRVAPGAAGPSQHGARDPQALHHGAGSAAHSTILVTGASRRDRTGDHRWRSAPYRSYNFAFLDPATAVQRYGVAARDTLTWPEAKARLDANPVGVLPVGAAAKEHGRHLPLNTDYLLARALAEGVAAALPVLIARVVCFGYYPAFVGYAGSQHLRAETFMALLADLIQKLISDGAKRIEVINTGVSTEAPLQIVARSILDATGVCIAIADIRRLGLAVIAEAPQKLGGHADEIETSMILAIAPGMVRREGAATDYGHALNEPKTVFSRPVRYSPNPAAGIDFSLTGARGDPTLADADFGQRVLAEMTRELIDGIRTLYPDVG
jgi:creatinine amidohydrolase